MIGAARQELLIKAAELLDMQAQLKESEGRQQLHQDAATDQVGCACVQLCAGHVSLGQHGYRRMIPL